MSELRTKQLCFERSKGVLSLWWLSFVDPTKPEGKRFLGVVILEAYGVADAVERASMLGLNPGGEVAGFAIPREGHPREFWYRLLKEEDLGDLGAPRSEDPEA